MNSHNDSGNPVHTSLIVGQSAVPEGQGEGGVHSEEDQTELQGPEGRGGQAMALCLLHPLLEARGDSPLGAASGDHLNASEGLAGHSICQGLGLVLLSLLLEDEREDGADDNANEDDSG